MSQTRVLRGTLSKRPASPAINTKKAKKNFVPHTTHEIKSPLMCLTLIPMQEKMMDPSGRIKKFFPYLIYAKHFIMNNKRVHFGISKADSLGLREVRWNKNLNIKAFEANTMPEGFKNTVLDIGTFVLGRTGNGFLAGTRLANGNVPAEALRQKGFLGEVDACSAEISVYARARVTFEHCLFALSTQLPTFLSPETGVPLHHFSFGLGEEHMCNFGQIPVINVSQN